ncbi:hypothetical protein BSKO_13419 [Bryopsis sp. KO-2023]|nr:hypothetical protein BSKO_13419 [Bryopsis sp. KO-2023]
MDELTLFNQYENEYCNKSTDVSRKIQTIINLSGDLRKRKVGEVEFDLTEAEQVIKRMEMEARSLSPSQSQKLLKKTKEYKADLQALKTQLRKASASVSAGDAARAELGLGGGQFSSSAAQRDRLLTATERLNKTNDRLQTGRQQLAQTEELGVSILQDLSRQRETIERSRGTLHGADDNIGRARKVLGSMSRRVVTNKIVLTLIAVLLLVVIFLVVYFQFIK